MKSTTKYIQISKTASLTIPVMVSVNTKSIEEEKEVDLEGRPSIDLICVIDTSGSMSGTKINLVKDTLKLLLDLLNEKDRLSLITFSSTAYRLGGLKKVNSQNKNQFLAQINGIAAGGGTSIGNGMSLAFKTLLEKKYKNQVNSIFLLSDGLDSGATQAIDQQLKAKSI